MAIAFYKHDQCQCLRRMRVLVLKPQTIAMQTPREQASRLSAMSLLRISVGIVYLWFGALKFFDGLSPAEQLAMNTIHELTFGLIDNKVNLIMLAGWECIVGFLLIIGKYIRPTLLLLFLHMVCTFTPFIFFPKETFHYMPYGLTLVGQYIMKNIIIVAAGIVLWKTEREKEANQHFSEMALSRE